MNCILSKTCLEILLRILRTFLHLSFIYVISQYQLSISAGIIICVLIFDSQLTRQAMLLEVNTEIWRGLMCRNSPDAPFVRSPWGLTRASSDTLRPCTSRLRITSVQYAPRSSSEKMIGIGTCCGISGNLRKSRIFWTK